MSPIRSKTLQSPGSLAACHQWLSRLLLAISLLALLSACGSSGTPAPVESAGGSEAQAESAYQSASYMDAARRFENLASSPAARAEGREDYYRLRAVDALVLAGEWAPARQLASRVDASGLSQGQQDWWRLLEAELDLQQGQPEAARQLLASQPIAADPRLEARLQRLRDHLDNSAAPTSLDLEQFSNWVQHGRNINDQPVDFLRGLDAVPIARLQEMSRQREVDANLRGWLDLAVALRLDLVAERPMLTSPVSEAVEDDMDSMDAAVDEPTQINVISNEDQFAEPAGPEAEPDGYWLSQWQATHRRHAMAGQPASDLAREYEESFTHPSRVAVLLPLEGRYGEVAGAIRDGLLAASLQGGTNSVIRFYNVGDDPYAVPTAYFDALDQGAEMIIGPLSRESVQMLASLRGLTLPVLALNQVGDRSALDPAVSELFYSFALSPEDEARQAADEALSRQFRRAALLAPESDWGERLALAFRDRFEAGGGQVLYNARYGEQDIDHSQLLRNMLQFDASTQRSRTLSSDLGLPLEYESQRRNDLDVIFLAARPVQARLFKPQLKYFDAGDIPVFATSHIYTGIADPRRDRDLNDISLPLPPLQLEALQQQQGGNAMLGLASRGAGSRDGFLAMGMDAWRLLPLLELLAHDPDLALQGRSGQLSVSGDGTIHRNQTWSEFRNGQPRAGQSTATAAR